MATTEIVMPNLSTDPMWQQVREELTLLLGDLQHDPKYKERVVYIRALMADPRFLTVGQVYFVPQMQPWPRSD
jgi:hypothetical protein